MLGPPYTFRVDLHRWPLACLRDCSFLRRVTCFDGSRVPTGNRQRAVPKHVDLSATRVLRGGWITASPWCCRVGPGFTFTASDRRSHDAFPFVAKGNVPCILRLPGRSGALPY